MIAKLKYDILLKQILSMARTAHSIPASPFPHSTNSQPHLIRNWSEPKPRSIGIKNTIISIKENITIDILRPTTHRLQASKASRTTLCSLTKVQQGSLNRSIISRTQTYRERRQRGRARERIATLVRIVICAVDRSIIIIDCSVAHENQCGSCV